MASTRFIPISWKVAIPFGILILAVVAFQMTYFPARQASQATQALAVKAQSVTSLISHDILAGFEFGDANAVKEVFKGAESDPDLRFLVLFDRSGAQFASTSRGAALPADLRPLAEGSRDQEEFAGTYLLVRRRVVTQGGMTGTLAAGFSTERIAAERKRNQLTAIPIGLAVLLPGLAVTLMLSRYIGGRLTRLGHMAERVADGDLTIAISEISTGATDEVAQLTNAFDVMASSLKLTIRKVIESEGALSSVSDNVSARSTEMIKRVDEQRSALDQAYQTIELLNSAIRDISEHVEKLKTAAEETSTAIIEMVASQTEVAQRADHLGESVSETSAATTQMVSAIKEVDSNLDFLRGFVTDTSASVSEMSASIAQVESNAAHSYELAQAVAESAEAGRSAVGETIDGMERARQTSAKTNEVVSRLGERSSQIGQILTVIQSITDQTNLLALNAAILAAQAGAHGAGFSVVADEIRDLSNRTTNSTKDIADLIRTVQEEVREALAATAEGSQVVEHTAKLSITAGERLSAILDSAKKSLDMGRNIATTTREQARGSQGIGEAIGRLDDLVKQISIAMSSQAAGSSHIEKALETMRDVTAHARYATTEQKTTATRIAGAADTVMAMSHQISALIADHVSQSGRIVGAMGQVRTIADGNRQTAIQMNDSVGNLGLAIRSLNEEVRKFRIRE